MDVIAAFVGAVRKVFGLDPNPGVPPDFLHLGLYPARVDKCAADGSTCDVSPADTRIAQRQNVRVRAGVAGAVAVVNPGAIVLLGFEGGDPGEPYIAADWQLGASVSKLTFNADALELGGTTYSAPQWDTFINALKTFTGSAKAATTAAQIATAAGTLDTAIASGLKATKVKWG